MSEDLLAGSGGRADDLPPAPGADGPPPAAAAGAPDASGDGLRGKAPEDSGPEASGFEVGDLEDRVRRLNLSYRHHGATAVLARALSDQDVGRVALVSSFGAESVVLLHLVSVLAPATPVLFLDTQMLFRETLAYQRELTARFGLTDMRVLRPDPIELQRRDPRGQLHRAAPDACCALRKTEVLASAMTGFDAWITGRKRFQGGARASLDFFEAEEATGRIKINPLAHWTKDDVREYMLNNRLPRHPLVAQGYPSIGCAPCTSPVKPGEDERAGRWRGSEKVECGIHFENGKLVRKPVRKEDAA